MWFNTPTLGSETKTFAKQTPFDTSGLAPGSFIIMIFCGAKQTQIFHPSKKTSEAECLNCGEIKPMGWIKKQMQHDLKDGFVGHLDQLVPDLIVEDDIYGKDRLTKNVKSKDVGSVTGDGEWEVQFLWWNSETQSNWWDGYIRHAILLQDKTALEKVKRSIEKKLATQDKDGYLGIYAGDLRY